MPFLSQTFFCVKTLFIVDHIEKSFVHLKPIRVKLSLIQAVHAWTYH